MGTNKKRKNKQNNELLPQHALAGGRMPISQYLTGTLQCFFHVTQRARFRHRVIISVRPPHQTNKKQRTYARHHGQRLLILYTIRQILIRVVSPPVVVCVITPIRRAATMQQPSLEIISFYGSPSFSFQFFFVWVVWRSQKHLVKIRHRWEASIVHGQGC